MSKPIHPEVVRLNGRIFAAQLKLGEVLNRAGIHRSTWSRWKKGAVPELPTIDKMDVAISQKIAEKGEPKA